ncbi:tryptophan halogenase family protein [Glaciecola siphonariae]|uniref:Tryptophan halogenase family protein n=1 Tax=Glaciecola siphonariae TaxID=521012 RepID=A0ABV9LSH3_9ALTE
MQNQIKKVVIAGGGTAGWMTAALMQKVLHQQVEIELVESEDIGIVGVGEATIPPIQIFNQFLGLDEKEFLKETNGTIKLAIQFDNWKHEGHSYFHTFGAPGANLGFCNFQHYWLRAQKQGFTQSLWDFDLNYLCCKNEVFNKINTQNPVYEVPYAYHFDSALYGRYLRKIAEKAGVKRTEGIIDHIATDKDNGHITGMQLKDGSQIKGDFFIDCTGTRALLIQKTLGVDYLDWSHLLPANRALAVQTNRFDKTLPYTRSIAHKAGWQWRIPLTHRNGNGIVYSSDYLSDDEAEQTLLGNLQSQPVNDVRKITFKTGRTQHQWHKNVVAIGLSSGFLEPLESTSIHLIQSAIVRLLKLFPHDGIKEAAVSVYNEESVIEYETIRDFIVLHYAVNERTDSDFWHDMRNLTLPHRLQQKIDVFKEVGAIFNDQHDIFKDASWLQVMMGQGLMPQDYHPAANILSDQQLMDTMQKIAHAKQQPMSKMLPHDEFIKQYVGA